MELSSLEGRLLADRFQLGALLGQGGYGAVFKGEQVSMGRTCAVKVLAPHLVSSDETVKRFELEARATSRLNHPNTIVVYDFGRDDDTGLLFLAMEFLEGDDLDAFVTRRGTMSVGQVVHVVEQMSGSLQDAHDVGLVHRDIKPKNAMVTHRGSDPLFVKVIDFGISKAFDPISNQRASFLELTDTGMVVGTPQYMSPEQLRNEAIDGRADQYALAITVYRMLTGRTPFQGASLVDVAVKHISESPLPLRAYQPGLAVSSEFEGVLLKALAKDRADRFETISEFAQALRDASDGPATSEPVPHAAEPWSAEETESLAFDSGIELDDTLAATDEGAPPRDLAFARTAGMEALEADESPVHLGGTLSRDEYAEPAVAKDDVPGSTLVVLRQGEEADEEVSDPEVANDGSRHEDVQRPETARIEGGTDVPPSESVEGWTLGAAVEPEPTPSGQQRRPLLVLTVVAILAVLVIGGVSAAVIVLERGGRLGAPDAPAVDDEVSISAADSKDEKASVVLDEDAGTAETTGPDPTTAVPVEAEKGARTEPEPELRNEANVRPNNASDRKSPTQEPAPKTSKKAADVPPKPESEEKTAASDKKSADTSPDTEKKEADTPAEAPQEPTKPGVVRVVLMPWGELFVDGKRRGDKTRQRVELAPGTYTFELRQSGKTRDRKRVVVESGKTESLKLRAR